MVFAEEDSDFLVETLDRVLTEMDGQRAPA
jgi:hypothetical protein